MRTAIALMILALAATAAEAQGRGGRGGRQGQDSGPKVGSDAPNFTATVLAKAKSRKKKEPEKVELKKVIEEQMRPVVLIFGSFT
ncbi:MAG: hypothetical protein ACYTAF_16940 [Planctomycetota bacterium]|jgi:hypothetical protein